MVAGESLIVIRICIIASLLAVCPIASAQDAEVNALFETVYGAKAKKISQSFDKKDDVAFGKELIEAADDAKDEPKLAALLYRKAYEFASKHSDGYPTAIEAMENLEQLDDAYAREASNNALLLLKRIYARSIGAKKTTAGEALMATFLKEALAAAQRSDWKGATLSYRQALSIATTIRSSQRKQIAEDLKHIEATQRTAIQIQSLEAKLKKNPSDSATADRLVKLYVVELDQPQRAAAAAAIGSDEKARRLIPGTKLKPTDLKPDICLELGDWYKQLATSAPKTSKGKMLNRSLIYYQHFLKRTEGKGLATVKANLAIKDIHNKLETMGVSADPSGGTNIIRPGQTFDLVSVIKPKAHAIRGGWATKGPQLANVEPAEFGLVHIPVTTAGSYDVTVEFTRKEGTTFMGLRIPVGHTSTAIIASWAPEMVGGLHSLDGMGVNVSPAKVTAPLVNGKRNKMVVQVRVTSKTTAAIKATLNAKALVNWTGPMTALAPGRGFADRALPPSFAASSFKNDLLFHKISLRMVKGTAHVITPMDQHLAMVKANAMKSHFEGTDTQVLSGWRKSPDGDAGLPVIIANNTKKAVGNTGTIEPGTIAIHPGSTHGMGITWQSPMTGNVRIAGMITDLHNTCGNGVNWLVHHIHQDGTTSLTTGAIEMGKSAKLANEESAKTLRNIKVTKGDFIQLAIMPKDSYSCDTTRVDFQISEVGGRSRKWNLARDLVPNITMKGKGNPHPDSLGNKKVWYFYEVPPGNLPKP